MEIQRSDGVIFVYTLAVMLTGVWLYVDGSPDMTPAFVAVLVVTSLVWTAYFRWTVIGRLIDTDEDEAESAPAGAPEEATDPGAGESP